jgi:GR25 family glycosyltransferase involved in LPS biosynthesis
LYALLVLGVLGYVLCTVRRPRLRRESFSPQVLPYPFPTPTWVITIDDARYRNFENRLGVWASSITRFTGTVGKELTRYTMCQTVLECPNTLTAGQVGCWLSHWRAWKHAAAADGPSMICEDDVQLAPNETTASQWARAWAELQTGLVWDVLFLSSQPRNRAVNMKNRVGEHWSRPTRCCGNFLYVLSPTGAAKLLAAAVPVKNRPVDTFIIDLSLTDPSFSVLCLTPSLGYVVRVVSTTTPLDPLR